MSENEIQEKLKYIELDLHNVNKGTDFLFIF